MNNAPTEAEVRALPKVDLHDHLDGGLRASTVIELAHIREISLPTQDPDELVAWILQECSGSLGRYLHVSDLMVSTLTGDADALHRAAKEFALDLASDGVVYAEVRWAPEEMATSGLSLEAAYTAVKLGLDAGVSAVRQAGGRLRVEQILCALRTEDRSVEIAELALEHRGTGVVAFDLAGAEDGFAPSRHRIALDLLAREGMSVTIHAGEAAGIESVKSAIEDGRARRIGHGVRIVEDLDRHGNPGSVARLIRDSAVALEMCPTSNIQTRAWKGSVKDHPFEQLRRDGYTVTVSPDNRLLSGVTLTSELLALSEAFGYCLADLAKLQRNAAVAAFLPRPDRDVLMRHLQTAESV